MSIVAFILLLFDVFKKSDILQQQDSQQRAQTGVSVAY